MIVNKVGDVAAQQGEAEAARAYFLRSLKISQELVAFDPEKAEWQRDEIVSYQAGSRRRGPAAGSGTRPCGWGTDGTAGHPGPFAGRRCGLAARGNRTRRKAAR